MGGWHKVAGGLRWAPALGFVLGLTARRVEHARRRSALILRASGSTPRRVVGTDVFHAAILLWVGGDRPSVQRQRGPAVDGDDP